MDLEPDMPTVELDMIIEEIDEDHTGRVKVDASITTTHAITGQLEILSTNNKATVGCDGLHHFHPPATNDAPRVVF